MAGCGLIFAMFEGETLSSSTPGAVAASAASAGTPGVSWRNRLPQERWIEPEDTALQVVAPSPQHREERTASVDSAPGAPAVAVAIENVERAAREAYLQEHARLMALEAARKAKRKRDAATLLLLM